MCNNNDKVYEYTFMGEECSLLPKLIGAEILTRPVETLINRTSTLSSIQDEVYKLTVAGHTVGYSPDMFSIQGHTIVRCSYEIGEVLIKHIDAKVFKHSKVCWLVVPSETQYTNMLLTDEGVLHALKYNKVRDIYSTTEIKLGKWLRNRGLSDKEVSKCIQEIHKISNISMSFKYSNLPEGYDDTSVSSCMQGCGKYFEAFTGVGKLLRGYINGEEVGRAIVWRSVYGLPEGVEGFMDRIYTNENHKYTEAFKKYARDNKLIHKKKQNYHNISDFIMPDGSEVSLNMSLDMSLEEGDEAPYMDTFRYCEVGGSPNNYEGQYTLNNTDGIWCDECCSCEDCGDTCNEEDTYTVADGSVVCRDCLERDYMMCEYQDEYYPESDIVRVYDHPNYLYVHEDHTSDVGAVFLEDEAEFYYIDSAVWCEDAGEFVHINNIGLVYSECSDTYSTQEEVVEVFCEGCVETWFESEAESEGYTFNEKTERWELQCE